MNILHRGRESMNQSPSQIPNPESVDHHLPIALDDRLPRADLIGSDAEEQIRNCGRAQATMPCLIVIRPPASN